MDPSTAAAGRCPLRPRSSHTATSAGHSRGHSQGHSRTALSAGKTSSSRAVLLLLLLLLFLPSLLRLGLVLRAL